MNLYCSTMLIFLQDGIKASLFNLLKTILLDFRRKLMENPLPRFINNALSFMD